VRTVPNAPLDPERTLTGGHLDQPARRRVLELFTEQLMHAHTEAAAQGIPAEVLAERIENRIAELRRQIIQP
jgi:hypothetical protein